MTLPVQFCDIEAAALRLKGRIDNTPMRFSETLSKVTGANVWLKFENLQFTASFKERGALNRLLTLGENVRKRGVIAMSAGNHAQGVAYHAQKLDVPTTIVMPKTTPFVKVEHTRNFGADVILHGDTLIEANSHAEKLSEEKELFFLHPFDDPDVIAGQGTIGLEMCETGPEFDGFIIPVGGGGLISGVGIAIKEIQPEARLYGVEPALYPSLSAELKGEEPQVGGATIAEGIAVKRIGRNTFKICKTLVDDVILANEDELEQAITLLANVEKTIVEGAGAAGLAALLAEPERFKGQTIGIILSGGNIDSRLLASVLTRSLVREKRLTTIRIIGDDRPGLLAKMSTIIGDLGANIIEVAHNRIALDVPAKGAEFDILVETRDAGHTEEIVKALTDAGYPPRLD